MKQHAVLPYALGLALIVSAYATLAQIPTSASPRLDPPAAAAVTHSPVPLSWVPDWLMTPLSRAIADATAGKAR